MLAASGGSQDLVKRLQDIGASSSYIENISDKIVDLRTEIEATARSVVETNIRAEKGFLGALKSAIIMAGGDSGVAREAAMTNREIMQD